MSRTLWLDCFGGMAGDMFSAALLAALGEGAEAAWRAELARLPLPGVTLALTRVMRAGVAATHLDVQAPDERDHRHLPEILAMIRGAGLSETVTACAVAIFERLAVAEARVHGIQPEAVHFHEVGAVDAIVDVVSAAVLLELAGVERVVVSPVRVGHGTVRCAHGLLPIPAPATAYLLMGVPTWAGEAPGEHCTPTGAAIVAEIADGFGGQPAMATEAIGWGAGTRDLPHANCVRAVLGIADATDGEGDAAATSATADGAASHSRERVMELQFQVDDMTGEALGFLRQELLAGPALDVWMTPVQMKKGRPGSLVGVLCPPGAEAAALALIFRESTTLGVRVAEVSRAVLDRALVTVTTPWGEVRAKRAAGRLHPEYEDCAALARSAGVPLAEVMAAARGSA